MGYPQEILVGAITRTSNAHDTAEVLTAAAAVHGGFHVHIPIMVKRLSFRVSTAISDLTASVVRLTKISQANVTTSLSGNMTIANGLAAGKLVYKDFSPSKVGAGETLQLEHLTQGGLGGTPAGAGFYGFVAELLPENMANETNASVG
jgi:hypothetical protein